MGKLAEQFSGTFYRAEAGEHVDAEAGSVITLKPGAVLNIDGQRFVVPEDGLGHAELCADDTQGMRVYAPTENGGRLTVGELIGLLSESPRNAAVFFVDGNEVAEEGASGHTAGRVAVEKVETVYWHGHGETTAVGYVRLVGEQRTWAGLFPKGRTVFYEGDDPEGFRQQILAEFGFDPAKCPGVYANNSNWDYKELGEMPVGQKTPTWDEDHGWQFHCPAEHLDAIYGNDRFPMGS
jgi:hypothetical protein